MFREHYADAAKLYELLYKGANLHAVSQQRNGMSATEEMPLILYAKVVNEFKKYLASKDINNE